MENTSENKFNRPKAFKIFGLALLTILILSVIYWFIFARNYVSTDDAYVAGSQVQIVSQIDGAISSVEVSETQSVDEGQTLFKIDPTEVKIASEKADIELLNSLSEFNKRSALGGDAAVSKEELEHTHLALLKAIENARQAYINLLRANVQSPIGAIVAKRYAQIGQRVAPGVPLALVVAANEMWVDANFKEDQLKNMRVGQPVRIESDIYGTTVEYRGHVAGFSPGTGSTLALLPPQNATGNWVKVVQRLPVRVVIDPEQLEKYPLHIGLSMNVRVDTANQSGIPLQAMSKGLVSETAIYSSQYEKAENHIQVLLKNQKQ